MHKVMRMGALAVPLVLAAGQAAAALATTATVFLRSEPGNYVGFGLPPAGATFHHGVEGVFQEFQSFLHGARVSFWGDEIWTFNFAAPAEMFADTPVRETLRTGFYWGATGDSSDLPRPYIDISGGSRGGTRISGWFNVLEIAYASEGRVSVLAVDFVQHSENLPMAGPALWGSLRFNSAIPVNSAIPEPATAAQLLAGISLVAGLRMLRRCRHVRTGGVA